jgi:hypothetical protein
MQQIFEYLIKLSGTLIILYLFYWLVLSRLTFYTTNRWYLLGYSLLAFFIPLIDISPVLEASSLEKYKAVQWVPVVETSGLRISNSIADRAAEWSSGELIVFIFLSAGTVLMLVRFLFQFFSVRAIRRASCLISDGKVKVYQVNKSIIPFSFGKAIFINQQSHTAVELRDIIRHELIHVKEKHTIDIFWSEWLCIVNWYNPFAWLIRKAIRQNLEFIADSKVLQNGVDRKDYQYLLLKVIGSPQYSIATNFNFSSLKKRIAMMNKMRSARLHFIKFLFIIPLITVMLLAFRDQPGRSADKKQTPQETGLRGGGPSNGNLADTLPKPPESKDHVFFVPEPNSKGYVITVADNHGECIVIVKNKQSKIVKAISLVEWDQNKKEYTTQFGEIPPAPSPSPKVIVDKISADETEVQPAKPNVFIHKIPSPTPAKPATPVVLAMPDNVSGVHIKNKIITVTLKNGQIENYNLGNEQEKSIFENKYGTVPASPTNKPNPESKPQKVN